MPDRLIRKTLRGWRAHPNEILLAALVVVLGLAIWGWATARNAEQRLDRNELAEKRSSEIGQVVTCYTAARSRPRLVLILQFLQNQASESDTATREAFDLLLSSFTDQATPGIVGSPTREKCKALALSLAVDDTPYDFDPATGKLLHPQGVAR